MTGGLPDFVVIGAMKSGTTTLYNDLASQPAICMTSIKEPSVLARMDLAKAAEYYPKLFRITEQTRLLGEASTYYAQLPRYTGVAERARELLGPELRVIYLVRNPVERAISHYHHLVARGYSSEPLDVLLQRDPTLVAFGRYAMQLEPWIAAFGMSRILVARFEDYVRDRAGTLARVGVLLDTPIDVSRLPVDEAFNRGEDSRAPGRFRPFIRSDLYSLWLRRLVPASVRARLRKVLLPAKERSRQRPSLATVDYLIDQLSGDADTLATLLRSPAPMWDFAATRSKYER